MDIYRQTDPRWSGLSIGSSPYKMGPFGCLTTCFAQALLMAGYSITPGDICLKDDLYDAQGNLLWFKVGLTYPQLHIHFKSDVGRYKFVQVLVNHKAQHWLLLVDGVYYDPEYGNTGLKKNYTFTGYICSADIDPAPSPEVITISVPVQGPHIPQGSYEPFETNLEPSQTYNPEVARMQHFLVDRGHLDPNVIGVNWGYYGKNTQDAVHRFQLANGITNASKYGWWYPNTRAAANKQLVISNHSV